MSDYTSPTKGSGGDVEILETVSVSSSSSSSSSGEGPARGFPRSIAEARRTLQYIFSGLQPQTWHNDAGITFVVDVLKEYPALAAELSEDPNDDLRMPLSQLFVSQSQPSLEQIQTVYELHPAAISQPSSIDRSLPLHDACWCECSLEVIRFLAQEYPEAATVLDAPGRLPIHYAIRSCSDEPNKCSLPVIQTLIDLYPGCLQVPDSDGKTLLESALYYCYSSEVLDYLVGIDSSPKDAFLCCTREARHTLDWEQVEAIAKVFPRVKFLKCALEEWNPVTFVHFINAVLESQSIGRLGMYNCPGELIMNNEECRSAFLRFLQPNTALSNLSLRFKNEVNLLDNFCDGCVQLLGESLRSNETLEQLELSSMLLSHVGQEALLQHVMINESALKHLVLNNVSLPGQDIRSAPQSAHSSQAVSIEKLVIMDCCWQPTQLEAMVQEAAKLGSLKHLHLRFDPDGAGMAQIRRADIVQGLVGLLERNVLETLELSSLIGLDFGPLVGAWANNTSLKTLVAPNTSNLDALVEILQTNTTLASFALQPKGRHDRVRAKAILLLRLNQCGRAQVQASNNQVVDILCQLETNTSIVLSIDRFNILYGLLCESPSTWCSNAV